MNLKKIVQFVIFESRWLLLVFYFGLIGAQIIYCLKFIQDFLELVQTFKGLNETDLLIAVLNLLDVCMIGNLVKMLISGSYQTFIEKLENDHAEKVTSGALKIKMASSLVGVSAINLLQTFVNPMTASTKEIVCKIGIHLTFLISAAILAWIEYLHAISENHEVKAEK